MPGEKWTDERLDGLEEKVDEGFIRVGTDIRELRSEMNQRFEKMDTRFEKVEGKMESGMKELRREMNARFQVVDARFQAVDGRFDSLQRSLFAATIVIVGAMIGCCASLAGVALL